MTSLVLLAGCATTPSNTCTRCAVPERESDATIRDDLTWALELKQSLENCNTDNGYTE